MMILGIDPRNYRKRGRQAADYAACAAGLAGCCAQFQGMSSSHRFSIRFISISVTPILSATYSSARWRSSRSPLMFVLMQARLWRDGRDGNYAIKIRRPDRRRGGHVGTGTAPRMTQPTHEYRL
jgi:hypothetical protein